jgi:hypothetical protein
VEVRRLRAGVLRLGGELGFDTRTVVRFSEAISGQRWRRCHRSDLERVVADFEQLARRIRAARQLAAARWAVRQPAEQTGRAL